MANNSDCKPCKKGSVIKPRYCGEPLDCIDVKKGDTYDSIIKKVNDALCNGGSGNIYEFEDNEDCDVSGFKVFEVLGEERVEIYSWCQECCVKENFYEENIEEVDISETLNPSDWSFPTVGYESLSFTNSSNHTKNYIVHASYDMTFPNGIRNYSFESWVEGAIIKTVSGVDSLMYKSSMNQDLQISLYSGTTHDTTTMLSADPSSPLPYVTTSDDNKLDIGFNGITLKYNSSFFKKVTLAPNETVSLKFKTKDSGSVGILVQGQIFGYEL